MFTIKHNILKALIFLVLALTSSIAFDQVVLAACSASSDFFCIGGNTKTGDYVLGMKNTSSSNLILKTNNFERLRINSTGNVGIGTLVPSYKLHISGGTLAVDSGSGTDTLRIRDGTITKATGDYFSLSTGLKLASSGGKSIVLGTATVGTDYTIKSDSFLALYTNNVERVRIDTSGNVGIGTTSPSEKLTIQGDGTAPYLLNVGGTSNGRMKVRHIDGKDYLSGSLSNLYLQHGVNFNTILNAGGSTGGVGIGTDTPAARLHIGSSTASEAIGAIFELPSNPVTNLPLIQWQGGDLYGKWRNYINHAEKGFLLTYNMPYNYSTNAFENRDVETGAGSSAYLWYDGLEGAYNFWAFGFGVTGSAGTIPNLDEGGSLLLQQGGNSTDFPTQGIVETKLMLKSPSEANMAIRMFAGRGQTMLDMTAVGQSGGGAVNLFKIRGYTNPADEPNPGNPTGNPIDLVVLHTDTGDMSTKGSIAPQNTTSKIYSGSGSPEGVVTANIGSLYLRTNGGAGTSFYVKESGSGNIGWVAK